jgi:hypothetical protein
VIPPKCILCFASGHRARHCRSACQHSSATIAIHATSTTPPPPHRSAMQDRSKPGLPSRRADLYEACATYSAEMVAAENDYHARGVIAIKVRDDPWSHLTRDAVGEAFGAWLAVPKRDIEVDFYLGKGFLVLLPSPGHRDRILSANVGLAVGQAKLQLLPWTRLAGADNIKLPFKIRLCIEGIPHHVRQPSTIRQLLPQGTLFESIDHHHRSDSDAQCCCVLVLSYEVIVHIDHIVDYRPPTSASADWPEHHSFRWRLGFRDDWMMLSSRRPVE